MLLKIINITSNKRERNMNKPGFPVKMSVVKCASHDIISILSKAKHT
jgi:hypothetical protein